MKRKIISLSMGIAIGLFVGFLLLGAFNKENKSNNNFDRKQLENRDFSNFTGENRNFRNMTGNINSDDSLKIMEERKNNMNPEQLEKFKQRIGNTGDNNSSLLNK